MMGQQDIHTRICIIPRTTSVYYKITVTPLSLGAIKIN